MGLSVKPWKPEERKMYAKLNADTKKQEEARKKLAAEIKKIK